MEKGGEGKKRSISPRTFNNSNYQDKAVLWMEVIKFVETRRSQVKPLLTTIGSPLRVMEKFSSQKKTELLCLEHLYTGDVGKLGCEVGGSTNYLPRRFNYAHPTTSPTATISPVPAVVATQVKFKLASFYKAMGRKKNAPTQ